MNEANLNMFWAIDKYLTYKISRYFNAYILLIGLKDDSGFFMNFEGGKGGVEGHLYKEKGPAVFAFIGNNYKILRNDDAKWIVDLALNYANKFLLIDGGST